MHPLASTFLFLIFANFFVDIRTKKARAWSPGYSKYFIEKVDASKQFVIVGSNTLTYRTLPKML